MRKATKVTPQQVVEALEARGDCRIPCHDCSICGYPCGYVYHQGFLWYDHGCDCTRGPYRRSPATGDDLAEWVNMQSKPENAERIWQSIVGDPAPVQAT